MKKCIAVITLIIVLVSATLLTGCGTNGSGSTAKVVEIEKVHDLYYLVKMDLTAVSHYDLGKEYAEQIRVHVPDYEKRIDSFLGYMIALMQKAVDVSYEDLLARAKDIEKNIPQEYRDEIQGMQSVFSYRNDSLGDGQLSSNEFLILNLFADVVRPTRCSASAVFGDSSATGSTIVARNLDWYELPDSELWTIQAVNILKNGDKSMASISFLGELTFLSAFNNDHIFASVLDSDTGEPYPPTEAKSSYTMALRYALENETTLQGVADSLVGKDYTFNHLIFLADKDNAQVLEENMGSRGRGLRTPISELRPGMTWDHPDAIATVNSFLLPENANNHNGSNVARWESYVKLYNEFLSKGKMGIDEIMQVAAYPGPDGKGTSGAIFRSRDGYPTVQSIIMRMDTYEAYVFFAPVGEPPYLPEYINVFSGSPFDN